MTRTNPSREQSASPTPMIQSVGVDPSSLGTGPSGSDDSSNVKLPAGALIPSDPDVWLGRFCSGPPGKPLSENTNFQGTDVMERSSRPAPLVQYSLPMSLPVSSALPMLRTQSHHREGSPDLSLPSSVSSGPPGLFDVDPSSGSSDGESSPSGSSWLWRWSPPVPGRPETINVPFFWNTYSQRNVASALPPQLAEVDSEALSHIQAVEAMLDNIKEENIYSPLHFNTSPLMVVIHPVSLAEDELNEKLQGLRDYFESRGAFMLMSSY